MGTTQGTTNAGAAHARIDAGSLRRMLADGAEIALLDVREEGVYARSHVFHAVSLPFSRLESRAPVLVPRRSTRIVLCDDGETLAARAAVRLRSFGYSDVAILAGGCEAWRAGGGELFSGFNVPSKALGEHVEHVEGTPSISADELRALIDSGADMRILDSRPMDEFTRMSIPGGIDCPGAELVYRVFETVTRPEQLVVVNCAGRTRSIVGAQSLINAGIPNRVVALRNGTMGWNLAGYATASGERAHAPPPRAAALARAREAAARVALRFGVRSVDASQVRAWRAEGTRTTVLFDVRSSEEYAAAHVRGARNVPGGQLVQATDSHLGTRNARLVLIDSDCVRATMTASWLLQLGWADVSVWTPAAHEAEIETGVPAPETLGGLPMAPAIDVETLRDLLARDAARVVDLATSLEYRAGHVPGARFAIRSRFDASLAAFAAADAGREIVLTSPDGAFARIAAEDAARAIGRPVQVLAGGTASWPAGELANGFEHMLEPPEDVYYLPYDSTADVAKAMQAYLDWELELVAQLAREGIAFPRFAAR